MVGGDFQKSLQLFVTYGYCLSDYDFRVVYHSSRKRRPTTPLLLFQSSLRRLGAPLSWRLLELWQQRCKAERRGNFKQNNPDSSFSLIFPSSSSSSFHLFFFFFLSSLPFLVLIFSL